MNVTRRQLVRAAVAAALAPLAGCAAQPNTGQASEQIQATTFSFDTVCVLGGVMEQALLDEALDWCDRYERLFSRTLPESDVARVNAAGGAPTEVDPLTADLVSKALAYCEASDGLFDITIGAVSELWDFAQGVVPDESAIAAALPHVGWEQVRVEGNAIALGDASARLDLGGIAKGYIADALVDLFVSNGVTSAFVNLGGNVKVLGPKADGTPWSIGVRDPAGESGSQVVAKVSSTGGSLVTSGLYERSFERDGVRYWHILDPRTGYPVQTSLASASLYSARSLDGDGYTKPLFMLDKSDALAFLAEKSELQGLLVDEAGGIVATPGAEFVLVG